MTNHAYKIKYLGTEVNIAKKITNIKTTACIREAANGERKGSTRRPGGLQSQTFLSPSPVKTRYLKQTFTVSAIIDVKGERDREHKPEDDVPQQVAEIFPSVTSLLVKNKQDEESVGDGKGNKSNEKRHRTKNLEHTDLLESVATDGQTLVSKILDGNSFLIGFKSLA